MKKLITAIALSTIALTLGIPKTNVVLAGGGVVACPSCSPRKPANPN